ncbi:hypothetical protein Tco_0504112, partial [Tanacetum coccineum]
ILQSSLYDQDVIDITPKDTEEGDASESLSGLSSMPDDDLASISGFETQDFADHVSEEGIETLHDSADKLAHSDPLGHLHAELDKEYNAFSQLESQRSVLLQKELSKFLHNKMRKSI